MLFEKCFGLKAGEKVLILGNCENRIAKTLSEVAKEKNCEVKVVYLDSNRKYSSPIPQVRKEMLWADVIAAPTFASITHSPEMTEATKNWA